MTIFTQEDEVLYNRLKLLFGALIPEKSQLEEFTARTNLNWKEFFINLDDISTTLSTEIIFEQSVSDFIPKFSETSKHIIKELPFCCLGSICSTNSLYFSNIVVLTCNTSGMDSIKNMIKYYLCQKQKPAIIIGIINQNKYCDEKIKIKNLESLISLVDTNHYISIQSYTIIYAIINNRILYPLFCDYF